MEIKKNRKKALQKHFKNCWEQRNNQDQKYFNRM